MKRKPLIGLNMSLASIADEDRWELQAPLTYADAVAGAGGLPVFMPPYDDPRMIEQMTAILDGVVFIGGADYHPHHFDGHPQPDRELMPERRDRFDVTLAQWILEKTTLPVLGICGGHQLLAIARGGALIQDIQTEWPRPEGVSFIPHAKRERHKTHYEDFRHPVTMIPGSLVARTVNSPTEGRLDTNSYHHQAVHPERSGCDLMASAWTDDGIIEALEPAMDSEWAKSGRFILGVQWHPERTQNEQPHYRLFSALISAAERRHGLSG